MSQVEKDNPTQQEQIVSVGSKVSKVGGDYRFDGTIVAAFTKLSGAVRYAVEDDRGVLHIYSRKNFTVVDNCDTVSA